MKNFIAENKIKIYCKPADNNPDMESEAAMNMDHWKCKLTMNRKQFTIFFSMGYGHKGKEPNIESVLDCLASDAANLEDANGFEDWAFELGYSPNSRKAEKMYRAVERQTKRLKTFLGPVLYDRLLWNTNRL